MRFGMILLSILAVGRLPGLAVHAATPDFLEAPPLSTEEKLKDFEQLVNQVKTFYGPLDYKINEFSIDLDQLIAEIRDEVEQSENEDQFIGALTRFLAKFQDGHISLLLPQPVEQKTIPIQIIPIGERVIVDALDPELRAEGISIGDEIIEVDGVKTHEYIKVFSGHEARGTKLSNNHLMNYLFNRRSYYNTKITLEDGTVAYAQPQNPSAMVRFKNAKNEEYVRQIMWRVHSRASKSPEIIVKATSPLLQSSQLQEFSNLAYGDSGGSWRPFFMTPETNRKFSFMKVSVVKDDIPAGLDLEPSDIKTNIHGYLYRYKSKMFFLLRHPNYLASSNTAQIDSYIKTYQVLLGKVKDIADVLVLDQTNNPGGFADYLYKFASIFAKLDYKNCQQFYNADRRWIESLSKEYNISRSNGIEPTQTQLRNLNIVADICEAIIKGQRLSSRPYPVSGSEHINPHSDFIWEKPMLVLIDERSGSCGDLFPMIMKENKRAKLFGKPTAGNGGNVEEMDSLHYSRFAVRLTRGIFAEYQADGLYRPDHYLEHRGVEPDFTHEITVEDYRAGYVDYVKSFSEKALEMITDTTESSAQTNITDTTENSAQATPPTIAL